MNLLLADKFTDLLLETSKLQTEVTQLKGLQRVTEERVRKRVKGEIVEGLKKLVGALMLSQVKEQQLR